MSSQFAALLNGACVVPVNVREQTPARLAGWLEREHVTIYHSVPALFRSIMTASGRRYPDLRIVRLEGDRVAFGDMDLHRRRLEPSCLLVNGLGTTETGLVSQYFNSDSSLSAGEVVPVGRPVEELAVQLLDDRRHPVANGEAAVVATQDIPGEPGLVAFVVQKVSPPAGADSLRQRLARTLPQSLVPTAFHVLPALPLDANGKVDRKRLVEENLVAFEIAPDAEPPETLVQQQLAEIWQELLQLDAVGIDQDFFDLGGTSLLAMHIFDEIESRLRVRLGPSLLLEGATILRLEAALLGKHDWSASLLPLQPNGNHPPLYFFHGDYIAGGLYCLELARQLG